MFIADNDREINRGISAGCPEVDRRDMDETEFLHLGVGFRFCIDVTLPCLARLAFAGELQF